VIYEKAERKLREARTRLTFARPYYASGAHAMRLLVTPEVPSLAVDEWWRLYANPGWVERYDVGQVATGLSHELQHLLLDHGGRARRCGVTAATMDTWNGEAADPDINDGLCADCKSCTPPLPLLPAEWCALPEHFGLPDGRVAEWYFAERMQVRREAMRHASAGDTKKNGGAGNGGRGREGDGAGANGAMRLPNFGCGSGATGVAAPWEVGSPEESGVDGLSDADALDVRQRVASAVKQHATQRGRGSVPLGLLEWSDELLRPRRIPWEHTLAHALRRASHTVAGAVQHSYARTSRRQDAFRPFIMPAYRRPVPNVVLVSDTSLSMADHRKLVRGVVDDACRNLGVPLRMIDVDSSVHRDVVVTSGKKAAQQGGGGTDMRVGIERAMQRSKPADAIVVCTDCGTPWPARKPKALVIVAAVGATETDIAAVPSWATVIRVEAA
jgi:predicted metal-dependent peptidase